MCAPTCPRPESSESDASDESGPKEDPPHLGARPASDLEGDPEAAELDREEAGGAEPPSGQLELAILNGLDISSLPALRDLSTRASTTVHIPWPPVGMERATPEGRRKASQAMAFLLGGRGGEHYGSWSGALRQRPECRLNAPDITTDGGMWTARMHNSTVCRVLDGLVSAGAMGHKEPEGMNEILRDIPPRRGVLPVPGPARGSPQRERRVRVDIICELFQTDFAVGWMTCFDPSTNWIRAVSRLVRRRVLVYIICKLFQTRLEGSAVRRGRSLYLPCSPLWYRQWERRT